MRERIVIFFHTWKKRIEQFLKKKKRKRTRQYTKTLVTSLTVMACIWISTSYFYAGACLFLYGNTEYLSDLSQQVCVTILGTVIVYALKSFFETFSERKQDLADKRIDHVISKDSDEKGGSCG